MIQRILAAIQTARTRPPSAVSAIIGTAAVGLGLALLHRYHGWLTEQIDVASDELDRVYHERDLALGAQAADDRPDLDEPRAYLEASASERDV